MTAKYVILIRYSIFALFLALSPLCAPGSKAQDSDGWKKDFAVEKGFNLSIDTEGYSFPSALAFVPNPGKGPKDPLYFVLELRGKVKVVTNDRSIYTFAEDFFTYKPIKELPVFTGENGLAGICLDPANGYVFVTFAYQDKDMVLRNNMVRFDSNPGTFSLKPISMTAFTDIFSREGSSHSHQIGPCQVSDGTLYVAVGDGFDAISAGGHDYKRAQSPDSVLGKILRMSLDGKPLKSNPYYVDDDVKKSRNYVWAVGLRNPFGLKIVDGHVFVADNGPSVDRILEVHAGGNYLWEGTDTSFSTNALVVFIPGTGVTQLDYLPSDTQIFPAEYAGRFYQSQCGDPDGDPAKGGRDIAMFDYSFTKNMLVSPPSIFVRYTGTKFQTLAGFAVGHDGLYIAPILPLSDGRNAVIKVTYDPEHSYPFTLENITSAPVLLESKGCYGCHTYGEYGWGTAGPNLDSEKLVPRIAERLDSPQYRDRLKDLDKLETEPYKSYRKQRSEVLEKKGIEKIRTWTKYHIMEPKFDNPLSAMPNLGISDKQAEIITLYLVPDPPDTRTQVYYDFSKMIPQLRYRYLVYSFVLGSAITLLIVGVFLSIRRKK